jgi:hypothetical protein
VRWLADENFNNGVIRGLLRRSPHLDIIRIQDAGLGGSNDEAVLAWAAKVGRALLTHDVNTITDFAYRRVLRGVALPGVFAVPRGAAISELIDDILLIDECSVEGEWEGRVVYLPFSR